MPAGGCTAKFLPGSFSKSCVAYHKLIEYIKSNLYDGNYELHKSPGDGHCLIHSVLFGLNYAGAKIEKLCVLSAIENETLVYLSKYIYFFENFSVDTLISEMDAYLYNRQYESSFGDIVPYILANALSVNIVIVSKAGFDYDVIVIQCDSNYVQDEFVTVYKCGMHYDAMTHKHGVSVGLCSGDEDDTFACDSEYYNLQGCVDDPSNCGSEARVSNNTDKNNPDAVICMMKETRDMKSNAPIPYPGNNLHHSVIHVNILFWNIHGLSQDKLSDNILGSMLKGYDMILLSETWASDHDKFVLEGYEYHNYSRKYRYINSTRHSGGLGVFIRQTIRGGIDIWCHNEDVVAWYILRKSFFGLKKDVYLGNVYMSI